MDAIMPAHLDREAFKAACQRPLRRAIRVNTLKISVEDFKARVEPRGWQLDPVPWCETGFWLKRPEAEEAALALGNVAEHLLGLFYIQEASSMMPPEALFKALDRQPAHVLDVAAAPGSKTTQMAALMQNQGMLVANEFSGSRIKGLFSNLQRLGIHNTALCHFDGRVFGPALPESFDAILLDAPCGGEGTIRKDEDALKDWSQDHIDMISAVQRDLIDSAFQALKVGGVLAYSTCTLNRQENQDVVAWLADRHPGAVEILPLDNLFPGAEQAITEEGFLHIWPQIFDSEGFFVAAIKKVAAINAEAEPQRLGRFPFQPLGRKDKAAVRQYFQGQFGIALPDSLWQRDKEIWLFPEGAEALAGKIRFDRLGLRLAETLKKGYRSHHDAIIALGSQAIHNVVELDADQARAVFCGRDIEWPGAQAGAGEVVLTLEGHPIGIGKWLKNKIKNNLPREILKDNLSWLI
ncbi:16S rRNA (cytosine(1407)-C(5))-methyltransferase RsmF [Gallaecimonas sp. GXIMD4217]|uniref:16S rRNA (cytosine(1407)-C(5))-methyltransferase RsmF n=1 Tax=Gallaecimonas sp. GXIMD4217 TaxID=3131927 RepID=UPI00311AE783